MQIKRQPLNLEELVEKSFRWHFLPSEFVSLSQNKAVRLYLHWFGNQVLPEDKSWFLSVANPTAANGWCIVGNLPNRVPDLPEFHSIGLQSDNLPVEKLARSARKFVGKIESTWNQLQDLASQSVTWRPLSLVAEVRAVGGKQHLSQLQGGAYWVWDTALTHSFTTTHGRRPTLCTPVQSGGGAPCPAAACLTTKLLNYSRQPANNAGKPSPSQSQKFPMRETRQVLTDRIGGKRQTWKTEPWPSQWAQRSYETGTKLT